MNVFFYELRAALGVTFFWVIATLMLAALYISLYPAFSKDAAAFAGLLSNIPPTASHILGANVKDMLLSFMGFFANVFPFITLIGGVQAAVMGFTILSKEQLSKTTDFLLTKPKSRPAIFCQKLTAGAALLFMTQAIVTTGTFILAAVFQAGDFNKTQFLMFWGAFSIIQFFMFTLGILISRLIKKIKAVIPPAIGLSFGLFLLALFGAVIGDETMRWLTPFRFIDYKKIISDTAYDPAHLIYAGALIVTFTAISYVLYTRKDIPAAL